MDKDTRNMKRICNMLHEIKQKNYYYGAVTIDELIATAELIYHERKENDLRS